MPGNSSKTAAEARLAQLGIAKRGLELELAAAYVGLSPRLFLEEVEMGRLPPPRRYGRRKVWDRIALDDALDAAAGRGTASPPPDPIMAKIHAARR
jgi:hypothetical protein